MKRRMDSSPRRHLRQRHYLKEHRALYPPRKNSFWLGNVVGCLKTQIVPTRKNFFPCHFLLGVDGRLVTTSDRKEAQSSFLRNRKKLLTNNVICSKVQIIPGTAAVCLRKNLKQTNPLFLALLSRERRGVFAKPFILKKTCLSTHTMLLLPPR